MKINRINNNNQIKVVVLASNVFRNSLGRAYMLAEALASRYQVTLIGPAFEEYNSAIWEPVKDGKFPLQTFQGNNTLQFLDQLKETAAKIDADIVIACKPRLPSLYLGLLAKALKNKPLILDIDDYELSFFNNRTDSQLEKDLQKPNSSVWTYYSELLIQYADQVLVSNHALQEKYGGTIVPHARDEKIFEPSLYDRTKRRNELDLDPSDKIVLFLGTPRKHKGVLKVLEAIKSCKNPVYKLCIIGTITDISLKEELEAIGGNQLILIPDQPFHKLAENVLIADLVCLIQDTASETSKYQLPAKAIDAIAMGIPVLATSTAPLKPLINQGLIMPTTEESLASDLDFALGQSEDLRQKQLAKRPVFLNSYSYDTISTRIEAVINKALENPKPLQETALCTTDLFARAMIEKQNLSNNNKELNRNIARQKREISNLKNELVSIQQSHSWRYTSPLRKLGKLFSKQK